MTGVSPGYVRTELATASIRNTEARAKIEEQMAKVAIAPEAIARTIHPRMREHHRELCRHQRSPQIPLRQAALCGRK